MKQFRNIKEALNYQANCPICQARTNLNYYDVNASYNFKVDGPASVSLSWTTSETSLEYDSDTGEIIKFSVTDPLIMPGGHLIERLRIECGDCCQYEYVIQVIIDLQNKIVKSFILNSERLTIDKNGETHEIRNIYSFSMTEYSCSNKLSSTLRLPLIPMDLSDPEKTLARIKNLIVFS